MEERLFSLYSWETCPTNAYLCPLKAFLNIKQHKMVIDSSL